MPLEKCPVRESLGANVAHPIAQRSVNSLLVRFQLDHAGVDVGAHFTAVLFAFPVQVPIGMLLQLVILQEGISTDVTLVATFRNGRVDPHIVMPQAGTVTECLSALVTLEPVRIHVLETVLIETLPGIEAFFTADYRVGFEVVLVPGMSSQLVEAASSKVTFRAVENDKLSDQLLLLGNVNIRQ